MHSDHTTRNESHTNNKLTNCGEYGPSGTACIWCILDNRQMYLNCNVCQKIQTPSCLFVLLCVWRNSPQWARASSLTRFLDHTRRRTTVGRTPLDEWSARRIHLYLTTHNTCNRQTSMPPGGIWTHNLSRRVAADLRLRPRGHWDRHHHAWIHHISNS